MIGRKRLAWGIAAGALLLLSAAGAVVAVALERAGPVRVEVQGKRGGDDVSLVIPAPILLCCLSFVPDFVLDEMPEEAASHLAAARAFCRGIADRPDFVLCDIENEEETVRIEKKGNALHVFVDSRDETARISIPIWIVERVVSKLDAASGPAAAGESS